MDTTAVDQLKQKNLKGKYLILGAVVLILIVSLFVLISGNGDEVPTAAEIEEQGYMNVDPVEFMRIVEQEPTYTLDVHTPQHDEHIPGTDAFIPYDELDQYSEHLPDDKETRIAIYCRSDNMSHQAAAELAEMGYENIYHLEDGVLQWDAAGLDREPMHFEEPGVQED